MGAWQRPHKQTGAWQRARCSYSSARGAGKPFAAHPFCFSPQCSLHLFPVHGIIANRTYYKWRSDREAEGARLLSEYAPKGHLGFESLLLRHDLHSPRNRGGFFACSTAGDLARASPNANAVLKGTTRATAGEWANGLGYFLNFHHLKPEAFSGFLR